MRAMTDQRAIPTTAAADEGTPPGRLSEDRVAAIVKAAYLLELIRR
jgi:hypothetical protein